ncbi:hypothetical protein JW926_02690 [Candidatus Sumerlaeota bacterium]|nr:hypothetical protein [Candidatus Sumerlaeota bacterium]
MPLKNKTRRTRAPGFYFLPKISLPLRSLLIVCLVSCGIIAQSIHWIAGFIPVLSGILLTLMKPVSNNPKIKQRETGKWVNVTDREFARIREHYGKTRSWGNSCFNPLTWKGNLFFLTLVVISGMIAYLLSRYSMYLMKIWSLDCGAFLLLFFLTGERQVYHPKTLLLKIDAFQRLMEFLRKTPDPELVIQPMLEVHCVKKNADIPTDARLTLRFRSAPEKFIGIQAQISLNRVGSRSFPYLYAVFLGKKGYDFKGRLSRPGISQTVDILKKRYILEPQYSEEADILVFRQKTTKTSGYHTDPWQQREIANQSIMLAKKMLQEASASS